MAKSFMQVTRGAKAKGTRASAGDGGPAAKSIADAEERLKAARDKPGTPASLDALPWIVAVSESPGTDAALRRATRHSPVANPKQSMPADVPGARWFIAPEFAVIELSFGKTTGQAREDVWGECLDSLGARRSGRPADGMLALVPVETLQGSPARVAEWGGEIARLSDLATSWLGVDLPVTVVVTRCDRLPGMGGFISRLANNAWGQAVGWWPNSVERRGAASEGMLAAALERLEDRLRGTGLGVVTRESDLAAKASVWECIEALAALRPSLSVLLKTAFAGRSASRLGGLFLAGDPIPGTMSSDAGLFVDDLARRFIPRSVDLVTPVARKTA